MKTWKFSLTIFSTVTLYKLFSPLWRSDVNLCIFQFQSIHLLHIRKSFQINFLQKHIQNFVFREIMNWIRGNYFFTCAPSVFFFYWCKNKTQKKYKTKINLNSFVRFLLTKAQIKHSGRAANFPFMANRFFFSF